LDVIEQRGEKGEIPASVAPEIREMLIEAGAK
jgi:hypothetical protein